ncbi:ATP-binding protein [Streptomyces sp. NPDC058268]|uniref:ATP-binding protein n=1 Tax=Streptomyces sp. NPDC058268 TaxID=3346413 RepID=UPI0036ECA5AC
MDARPSEAAANTPVGVPSNDAARDPSNGHFRAFTAFVESPSTVRATRDMVGSCLQDWGVGFMADDARLIVSELVSNVVHHAVPDNCLSRPGGARRVDVLVKMWPNWLFIGVADEDSTPPDLPAGEFVSPELAGGFAESLLPDRGRGLLIVQRLADAVWWSADESGGKTVWCRFELDAQMLNSGLSSRDRLRG